jgi:hypothetical protein
MEGEDLVKALTARKRLPKDKGWRCLDETQLAAYVDARLQKAERERVENHLAGCDFCLDLVTHLMQMERLASLEVPPALLARAARLGEDQGQPARVSVLQWGLATGAATSVVLLATLWWAQPDTVVSPPVSETSVESSPPTTPQVSSPPEAPTIVPLPNVRNAPRLLSRTEIEFPREGSVVSPAELELRWQPVGHSLFYEVRLVASDGSLVWEGRSETASLRVPTDVVLVPGEKYFVWVRAHLSGGKTLKSETVGFTVAPKD